MKTKLALIIAALISSTAMAHDDSYNVEIEYNFDQVKHSQTVNNNKTSTKDSDSDWLFTYYFDDIDTSFGPRAEAAFLNRAGSLSLPAGGNESSLGFEYFGQDHDFYIRLQNENNIHDQIHLGWMVDTNWLVAAHGKYSDFDGGTYGIYSKKVFFLDKGGFINAKLGYDKTRFASTYGTDTEQFYGELDYYVDEYLSYGVTIANNQNDFGKDKYSVEYRTQWFATDNLSFGLSYTNGSERTDQLLSDGSTLRSEVAHAFSAKVKYRF